MRFAWRCGVRALPFLGRSGSFSFWGKKDRKKHIYSIFYALDFNAYAYDAADAAVAYNAAYDAYDDAAADAAKNNINLESIILQDLIAIRNKKRENQLTLTDLYGEVWGNFQKALEAEGCAYWGRLYLKRMKSVILRNNTNFCLS